MRAIAEDARQRMERSIDSLGRELSKVRTGRASLSILDDIQIDVYGQLTPLAHVATLNIPEPRMITIQPWDAGNIAKIEKAIQTSQLGLTPVNDGQLIRVSIPQLTEERRRDLVKLVGKLGEEARVSLRNIRRDANDAIKNKVKEDGMSEDEVKRAQQEIQKLTDSYVAKVDDIINAKEKDVMTV